MARGVVLVVCWFFGGVGFAGEEQFEIGVSVSISFLDVKKENISACNLQNGGACFEIRMYSH